MGNHFIWLVTALAAISLIILSQWFSAGQFSYFVVGLIGCCIFAAIKIKKTYLTMLLSTLQSKESGNTWIRSLFE